MHRIASSSHYPGESVPGIEERWSLPEVAHAHMVLDALAQAEIDAAPPPPRKRR